MAKKNLSGDYRQFMDKNFIGEWDLPENDDLELVIDHTEVDEVKTERGSEEKLCVHFNGGYKPLIVNATNGANIKEALGTSLVEKWPGQRILLYRERVSAFGKTTMAIRVRPFPPKTEVYKCMDCGCEIQPNGKFTAKQIADAAKSKYGRYLCMDCGHKAKEAQEAADKEGDVLDESNED